MRSPSDEERASVLLAGWRANVVRRFGRAPGDWEDVPAGRLVAAAVSGELIALAADAYGRSRCAAGWTLPEVFDDLADLFAAEGGPGDEARWTMARAATEGWAEMALATTIATPYRDPLTGLPTVGYLIVGAEALYAPDRALPAPQSHSLVILRLRNRHGLARVQRLLDLARRASACFAGRCALAALDAHGVVALIENEAGHYALAMEAADLDDVEMTLEPVPATIDELEARLASASFV